MSIAESGVNGRLAWFTSSYSNGAGGECVQCALAVGGAWVRDSKQAGGPVVAVGIGAWLSFVDAMKQETNG
ncbi:DUF397 domain-containing protein [Streptomyces europaeiscabiei]|uniref:DUF397 domain-containing protein n=1 Tax=Streptomyces europaeiscabiei TaxID=146819 RepID=UPI002E1075AC|nr:DUF397 domain-containing protein [Streptomyces europaeiscabiei]